MFEISPIADFGSSSNAAESSGTGDVIGGDARSSEPNKQRYGGQRWEDIVDFKAGFCEPHWVEAQRRCWPDHVYADQEPADDDSDDEGWGLDNEIVVRGIDVACDVEEVPKMVPSPCDISVGTGRDTEKGSCSRSTSGWGGNRLEMIEQVC
jgi:hypothetical protein